MENSLEIARQLCIGYGTGLRALHNFIMTGEVHTQLKRPNKEHLRSIDEYHEYFMVGLVLECPTPYYIILFKEQGFTINSMSCSKEIWLH